jgi:SWI/SNF-related matrix-associated actin-dependent regulator 1 of chromatin subfamily A
MTTTLLPFQAKGVRKLHHFNGRALLADEPGLGKTVQCLFYAREVPEALPIVVVCPAFVKWHWEHDARKHIGMRSIVLEGKKPFTRSLITKTPMVIINYTILQYWVDYLIGLKPQMVIVDECHNIKHLFNYRTAVKCTQAAVRLCKGVPRVIMTSGTPMTSRPVELYPPLHILQPKLFPSFFDYGARYCSPRKRFGKWEYNGANNVEELHDILNKTCMIRRLKKDVLKDLPPKVREVYPVDMKDSKEYKLLDKDFGGWLRSKYGNNKKKLKGSIRAQAFLKIGALKRIAALAKLPAVFDWIDNFLETTDEKLIVYGIHKVVLSALHERYGGMCIKIDGSTPRDKRKDLVNRFNTKRNCRLLFGNIQACGVGWSATACSTVLFVELGWLPGEHTQAEDRVHGMYRGVEGNHVFIHYLVARGTVEEKICELLQKKQEVLDAVLEGRKMEDFNLLDKLLEVYANVRKAA